MEKRKFQLAAQALEEHFEIMANTLEGMLRQDDGGLEKADSELGRKIRGMIATERDLVRYIRSRRLG